MSKYLFGCLMILVVFAGCREKSKINDPNSGEVTTNGKAFKENFKEGNYSFQIDYNDRLDSSYLDISYRGQKLVRVGYKGMIETHFIDDLDKNRKKELYLVSTIGESTELYAVDLNIDQFGEIIKSNNRIPSNTIGSTFTIKRKQVIQKYDYKLEDGSIKKGEARYNLVKKNDGLVLLPQGWQSFELENLLGQYEVEEDQANGLKQVLLIGERLGGKYNVDIKVNRTKDGVQVCHFKGLGEFVDRDLFIALNQKDHPELKGSLQIKFINAMATVYTENREDYKEMAAFCTDIGSIAGNYKKIENE